jgi:alkylated DNA repair protein alkB family protein 7
MLLRNIPAIICSKRSLSQLAATKGSLVPEGFMLFSEFFDTREQRLLLTTALSQLDALEGKRVRKLQREHRAKNLISESSPLEGLFLPEQYYTFQEVGR